MFTSLNLCAETKLDMFTADCIHTLINFMGHVTERAGKNFMLSRQTLHHMAYTPGAVLAFDRDEVEDRIRYPHGGLVFVPDEERIKGTQVSPTFK